MNKFVDLENNTWVKNNKFSEKNEIVFEKATNPKNVLGLIKNLNADIESFIDDWVRDGLLDGIDLSNKDFFTFKAKTIDDKGEWVAINSLRDVNISMAFPKNFSIKEQKHFTDNLMLWLNANWDIDLGGGGFNDSVWYFNIDYEFLNEFYDNEVDLQNKQ